MSVPAIGPVELQRVLYTVDATHQLHGEDCTCGFSSARARTRTEHITTAVAELIRLPDQRSTMSTSPPRGVDALIPTRPTVTDVHRVDQTIFAADPTRLGNCVSACVATHLAIPLDRVPHFVEVDPEATVDGSAPSIGWWWLLIGFMAGNAGLWPVELDDVTDGLPGEVLWVAGPSERGVQHQVLYRDGRLWHDPHPSRAGVLEVTEVLAWRPRFHDHTPSTEAAIA